MILPDVIVVHPLHLDYPLWRYNMIRFQKYFRTINVVLSNHHQEDNLSNFVRAQLPFAKFVEASGKAYDWRDGAINECLDVLPPYGYILFLEQDFFIKDGSFFEKVFRENNEFIYYMEGERTHPAFALVSRRKIEKTSRDFKPQPGGDHFKKFFEELSTGISLEEMGAKRNEDFYHLNGLSQNYMNFIYDEPFHNRNMFLAYNAYCQYLPIENHPKFFQLEKAIQNKHGHGSIYTWIQNFFPQEARQETISHISV